ncbi:hypothetical protein [Flavobacterium psychrotolerans]|uniref:Nicotinate-nucleotide adenylyltransferase n=1 Tax=Flavobacterium psychrotolerans TaxID=2169410 RepID=A0A2U1JKX2_9FLAO|nr:hypothetical protein [Flavobacterium psychrotolerans]PWA05792.1 hypothetical protein DB895_05040 [Flavobacterium psychrotolerans]
MKSFVIALCMLGLTPNSYSQVDQGGVSGNESLKTIELPEVVVRRAGKDFSVYMPDRDAVLGVKQLEKEFIGYKLGKEYQGEDSYLVIMNSKKGTLTATYNENGKLTSVVENYKNIKLPGAVIYSIYKTFPGWKIVNDKYLYSQKEGDIVKKQYHVKLKKDKKVNKIIVHPNGEILKGG